MRPHDTAPAVVLQHPSARVTFDVRAEAAALVKAYRAVQQAQFDLPTPQEFATLDAADAIDRLIEQEGLERFLALVRLLVAVRGASL